MCHVGVRMSCIASVRRRYCGGMAEICRRASAGGIFGSAPGRLRLDWQAGGGVEEEGGVLGGGAAAVEVLHRAVVAGAGRLRSNGLDIHS